MCMSVYQIDFGQHYASLLLVFVSLFAIASCFTLSEIQKPGGPRRSPNGPWKLPLGPFPKPVYGNLFQILRRRSDSTELSSYVGFSPLVENKLTSERLASLAQYGEMTTLRMGAKTWVLLNSNRRVTELIAKRGNITGERPYMPIASGLVSRNKRTVLR